MGAWQSTDDCYTVRGEWYMKKSRVEDLLIERERSEKDDINTDDINKDNINKDNINTVDSDGVDIVDLTDIDDEPEYRKENKVTEKISNWYSERKDKRKKKRRGKGRLRRICAVLVCSIVITFIAISIWNVIQMKQVQDIRSTIDETYNVQQLKTDCVERLGNLFTIHDKASFDWCMNNIDMTNDVKANLFTVDDNGQYTYKGQDMSGSPSFQCTELMFANSEDPLKYFAQFRVVLANGGVRYFFVVCSFRERDGKMVLTSFYYY